MIPRLRDAGETHVGMKRKHNEDNFLTRSDLGVWAVADGAGGHQSGALASSTIISALNCLPAGLTATELVSEAERVVFGAHHALCLEAASRGPATMIVSTVVILIIRDQHFTCLWAGDSRAYLFRAGMLTQITHDHSLVQTLVDQGQISEAEAERHPQGNIITRAVGARDGPFELDKVIGNIQSGDKFLLCSDGVSKSLSKSEITKLLQVPRDGAPSKLLIAASLAHFATDNITAITIEIL
jgi:serine/threonine-protein phosphatase Stp1